MTKVRFATPDDVKAFYGESARPTIQAAVLEVDGEILGIGGVYFESGKTFAFSEFKPGAKAYPLSIMRGAKLMMSLMRRKRGPIYAIRDESVSTSQGFLTHFGFEPAGEYYVWHS